MNWKLIIQLLGFLLIIEGLCILSSCIVSLVYDESNLYAILLSSLLCIVIGGIAWYVTRRAEKIIGKREGFLIVTLAWTLFTLFGALPFVFTGEIPGFTDAFFETMSGFTTTGATILDNIEGMSHALLFWRSMTQWLGGMGIIVLSLAILPLLGVGGMQLFVAEMPGPTKDKLHPRIKETAKRLWAIYLIYTIIETILLVMGGMNLFDAVCHSFTTLSSGGYSTKQASLAYYDSPFIHYVVILFMFIAGTNFTLSYVALHLRFRKVFENEEFRFYAGTAGVFSLIFTAVLFLRGNQPAEECFRESVFQVVSVMTTTGFSTVDYMSWPPMLVMLVLLMMLIGGSAGSTSGGIKAVRVLLLIKNSYYELKRMIHPNAVVPLRLNRHAVPTSVVVNIIAFITIYALTIAIGAVIMALLGYDVDTSIGAIASSLGNIGPALGSLGPAETFSHLPAIGKWLLAFLMLFGRLELFTVFIILSPGFYKK